MKRIIIILILAIFLIGCAPKNQIANPASVYCEEQGGKLEIRTDANGDQVGYCKFDNGKECEEWAFYRKECSN